jgi:hypothetical protein
VHLDGDIEGAFAGVIGEPNSMRSMGYVFAPSGQSLRSPSTAIPFAG